MRKIHLIEADKTRFLKPIWPILMNDWPGVMLGSIYEDKYPNPIPFDTIIKWVNSSQPNDIDWNIFRKDMSKPSNEAAIFGEAGRLVDEYYKAFEKRENKKLKKTDPKSLFKDEELFQILSENDEFLFVAPLCYEAAVFMDSFQCGGAGARWCIGYEQSSSYWDSHTSKGNKFILAYNKKVYGDEEDQKYMFQLKSFDGENCNDLVIWRQDDDPYDTLNFGNIKEFGLSGDWKELENWYSSIKLKVNFKKEIDLSKIIYSGDDKIFVTSDTPNISGVFEGMHKISYARICNSVKTASNSNIYNIVFDQNNEKNKNIGMLDYINMVPHSENEYHTFIGNSFKPNLVFENWDKLATMDCIISEISGSIDLGKGSLFIGTLFVPYLPELLEVSHSNDPIKILDAYNREAGKKLIKCGNLVVSELKFLPTPYISTRNPEDLDYFINHQILKTLWAMDEKLQQNQEMYLLDFNSDICYFQSKDIFDLSTIIDDEYNDKLKLVRCLNVLPGKDVNYSTRPDVKVEVYNSTRNNNNDNKISESRLFNRLLLFYV